MILLVVKSTLILAVTLVLLRASRRFTASLRHRLAAVTFGVLLLLPVVAMVAPERVVKVPNEYLGASVPRYLGLPEATAAVTPEVPRYRATEVPLDWGSIAAKIYFAGSAFFILSLLGGIARLLRLRANAEVSVAGTKLAMEIASREGMRQPIEVMITSELAVPMTFGASRATILLPAESTEWDDVAMRRAIRHELEHIQRGDWMTQIASRLACALYWPHPFVWMLWQRLRLEAERACDDAVIRGDAAAEAYAEQLVTLARRVMNHGQVPALAMATRSNLGQRVEAILDRKLHRERIGRFTSASLVVIALAVLIGLAPLRLNGAMTEKRASVAGALGTALMHRAGAGDLEGMRELIEAGADVNAAIHGDGSPMIAAARKGHVDAIRLLLDNGADIDRGVQGDGNAIIAASRHGQLETVRFLLDRGADIEQVVPGDENALINASAGGRIEIVRLLIERGANVNARVWADFWNGRESKGEWRTPLKSAQRHGHEDVVQLLRSAGARE